MFTGLVEEVGRVVAVADVGGGRRLAFACERVAQDLAVGDSIAVNGCCLTVETHGPGTWSAVAVPETLARTGLGALAVGDRVNLERPLRIGDRLGGHLVQGHVDEMGRVATFERLGDGAVRLVVAAAPEVLRYVVEKGSITIDGVSLTVVRVDAEELEVALIPQTLEATTLGGRRPGDTVNLEVDVLAKYVERLAAPLARKGA